MKKGSGRHTRLETRLSSLETPLFLLDASRKIVFFNQGCEKILEWSADEILGQTCDFAVDTDPDECESVCNILCPPPEVFEGVKSEVPRFLLAHSGKTIPCVIRYSPLLDEQHQTKLVLGIIDRIEEPHSLPAASPSQQLHAELAALRLSLRNRFRFSTIVARNDAMQRVMRQLELAVHTSQPVHFYGEPGSGKEHFARAIHFESEQRRKLFIPLECDRLPPRELKQTVRNIFDQEFDDSVPLEPGALFLSCIEALSRDIQEIIISKYQSFASKDTIRLMTASSSTLSDLLEQELILPEFYYLISTMEIKVPALRERRDDLELLAQHFLENENRYQDKQLSGFAPGVLSIFQNYVWPGNLDELTKTIQSAFRATSELQITQESLPLQLKSGIDGRSLGPPLSPAIKPLEETLHQVETECINYALEQCKNNRTEAAKRLGLTRAKLYRRMEVLDIGFNEESR